MHIPYHWQNNFNILIFEEIDSTNEELKRIAKIFTDGEFVVWSYAQTAGKGRNGNKWISPKNNMYLSLLLRSKESMEIISYLPFITAIAVGEYIASQVPNKDLIEYKWPNDILYDGQKIAGILIETKIAANSKNLDWIIIGCGLNLVESPQNLPYPATNLKKITGKEIFSEDAIDVIIKNLSFYTDIFKKNGFASIRKLWLQRAFGIGGAITVSTHNTRLLGVFEDIDQEGAIILKLSNGEMTKIMSGEVFITPKNQIFNIQ